MSKNLSVCQMSWLYHKTHNSVICCHISARLQQVEHGPHVLRVMAVLATPTGAVGPYERMPLFLAHPISTRDSCLHRQPFLDLCRRLIISICTFMVNINICPFVRWEYVACSSPGEPLLDDVHGCSLSLCACAGEFWSLGTPPQPSRYFCWSIVNKYPAMLVCNLAPRPKPQMILTVNWPELRP